MSRNTGDRTRDTDDSAWVGRPNVGGDGSKLGEYDYREQSESNTTAAIDNDIEGDLTGVAIARDDDEWVGRANTGGDGSIYNDDAITGAAIAHDDEEWVGRGEASIGQYNDLGDEEELGHVHDDVEGYDVQDYDDDAIDDVQDTIDEDASEYKAGYPALNQ